MLMEEHGLLGKTDLTILQAVFSRNNQYLEEPCWWLYTINFILLFIFILKQNNINLIDIAEFSPHKWILNNKPRHKQYSWYQCLIPSNQNLLSLLNYFWGWFTWQLTYYHCPQSFIIITQFISSIEYENHYIQWHHSSFGTLVGVSI